jgi:hypothetical protein
LKKLYSWSWDDALATHALIIFLKLALTCRTSLKSTGMKSHLGNASILIPWKKENTI